MSTIGQRIKEKRIECGLQQIELAEKANISKQTLYKYENDIITNIPSDKLENIANVLEVSPAYLMGWTASIANALNTTSPKLVANIMKNDKIKRLLDVFSKLSCESQKSVMDLAEYLYNKEKDVN